MTPDILPPTDRFRRTIDRAVARARAAAIVGRVGRLACAAATAVAIVAAVDLQLRWSGFWAGGSVVAAVVGLLAWRLLDSKLFPWPNRLQIALATEAANPDLGEQLSRAVEFLDAAPAQSAAGAPVSAARAADADATLALRSLAIEQAAAAVGGIGRPSGPELRQEFRWGIAGLLAVAAIWISAAVQPHPWGDCIRRQLVPATALHWPAAGGGPAAGEGPATSRSSGETPYRAPPPIPAATVSAWRRIEAMRRLTATTAGKPGGESAVLDSLRRPLERAAAESRDALAAAPQAVGSGVLTTMAAQLARLGQVLATGADPPAERLDEIRRSLDSLAALARAAAGIADASVLQSRLASILADRFSRHPGLAREYLPQRSGGDLDRLATLQAECLSGIAADLGTLRLADDGTFPVDPPSIAEAARDIADNRLAIAAAAAERMAAALARAADRLGMPAMEARDQAPAVPSRTLRTMAELGRTMLPADDQAAARDGDGTADRGSSAATAAGGPDARGTNAGEPSRAAAGGQGGTPAMGGGMPGAGGRAATTEPTVVAAAGDRQQRVWNLLPARERPEGVRADDVPVAAAYREAVEAYYRALLESSEPGVPTP